MRESRRVFDDPFCQLYRQSPLCIHPIYIPQCAQKLKSIYTVC